MKSKRSVSLFVAAWMLILGGLFAAGQNPTEPVSARPAGPRPIELPGHLHLALDRRDGRLRQRPLVCLPDLASTG